MCHNEKKYLGAMSVTLFSWSGRS